MLLDRQPFWRWLGWELRLEVAFCILFSKYCLGVWDRAMNRKDRYPSVMEFIFYWGNKLYKYM